MIMRTGRGGAVVGPVAESTPWAREDREESVSRMAWRLPGRLVDSASHRGLVERRQDQPGQPGPPSVTTITAWSMRGVGSCLRQVASSALCRPSGCSLDGRAGRAYAGRL